MLATESTSTQQGPSDLAQRTWVRIDGQPVDPAEASVSVFDHGLLYGDGIFEAVRFANRRIFELDAHIERLLASARVLRLEIAGGAERIATECRGVMRDSGLAEGYIRFLVTRGTGDLGLDPASCPRARTIAILGPISPVNQKRVEKGVTAITIAARQRSVDGMSARVKSLNYLPNVLALLDARAAGADEGIILNPEGFVSEGTVNNVFVVRGDVVSSPHPACGALLGITASAIRRLLEGQGVVCEDAWLTRYDLYTADEVFLTGTAVGIVPVVSLDGCAIGSGAPGPVVRRVQSLLHDTMTGEPAVC